MSNKNKHEESKNEHAVPVEEADDGSSSLLETDGDVAVEVEVEVEVGVPPCAAWPARCTGGVAGGVFSLSDESLDSLGPLADLMRERMGDEFGGDGSLPYCSNLARRLPTRPALGLLGMLGALVLRDVGGDETATAIGDEVRGCEARSKRACSWDTEGLEVEVGSRPSPSVDCCTAGGLLPVRG